MSKTNVFNVISGTCFWVGLGGLGGACDTGKGFFLSIIILAVGFIFAKLNDY